MWLPYFFFLSYVRTLVVGTPNHSHNHPFPLCKPPISPSPSLSPSTYHTYVQAQNLLHDENVFTF